MAVRLGKTGIIVGAVALGVPLAAAGIAVAAGSSDPNDYVRSVEYVRRSTSGSATTKTLTVPCPSPKMVLGGGAYVIETGRLSALSASRPLQAGNAWTATAFTLVPHTWTLEVWAVCADVHGSGP